MSVALNDAVRRLLDDANHAVLATINEDGSPQTSVVWVDREDDQVVISTRAGRRKDQNMRRDPRVSLSVFDRADPGIYAEIRGEATITGDPDRAFAVRMARKYEGPDGGGEFLRLPPEHVRVVVRITPDRVTGYAAD